MTFDSTRRLLQHVGQPPVAAPVVGHRSPAVRDDQPQVGQVSEQVALEELHEGRRVGVDVVRAGRVEHRVGDRCDVHHRRDVELDQRLVDGVPAAVGQGRGGPVPPAGVGVEVAADERRAPPRSGAARRSTPAGRHRATAAAGATGDEAPRVEGRHPVHEVVAPARPLQAHRRVTDVGRHGRRARREQRDVDAPLVHQPQLARLDGLPDLVVADRWDRPAASSPASQADTCCSRQAVCAAGAVV